MDQSQSVVYLIPSLLDEEAVQTIPSYLIKAVKDCQVLFVENERTARRYLKKIWREIVIDNYEWVPIEKMEHQTQSVFKQKIKEKKNIAIISEAGCPGVADPGQSLVAIAHDMNVQVKPVVGPSSILLALMASGMNGQQFQFVGYLPVDPQKRASTIQQLESESQKKNCTQIFIETPYRNNQLIQSIIKVCKPSTRFCVAADLTAKSEWIRTKKILEWKKQMPDLNKRPSIFLLLAE
jgi:16S rRNA (cytidine1402-2'-O)-methyltransferase